MKKSHKPFSYLKQKHTKGTSPSFPSPSSSHVSSPQRSPLSPINGSPLSQPQFVDLARCDHQKFWKLVTRNFARYLTCYRETDTRPRAERRGKCRRLENNGDDEAQESCRYYSEMSDEERAEKLRSAIKYCNANCSVI
ncbi:hypothetical protein RHMOL_Rhmol05G0033700 [Rhododendron molle]|uniref:Uncharacterized protein n=1 Tax=Rhododendron molle TaxID=49168 RepID=A0ACC0NM69_RHOML|nr:hypothetical protein RHMOL_Rhmol05G0033700 [Rhododendron molle]